MIRKNIIPFVLILSLMPKFAFGACLPATNSGDQQSVDAFLMDVLQDPTDEYAAIVAPPPTQIECGSTKTVAVPLNRSVCGGIKDSDEPGMIYRCDDTLIYDWDYLCRDVLQRAEVVDKLNTCRESCMSDMTSFYRSNYTFICQKPPACPALSTCRKSLGGSFFNTCHEDPETEMKHVRLSDGMCQTRCIVHYSRKILGNFLLTRACADCVPQ